MKKYLLSLLFLIICTYSAWTSEIKRDVDNDKQVTITVNGVTFKMIVIEGGAFTMGATNEQVKIANTDELPHKVTLSSFCIGQTEVTEELWKAVMGYIPDGFRGDIQRPVDGISWNDCQVFISKLNRLTGKHFRLPTEAEWEYAARGGNKSRGYKYAGGNVIDDVAWYNGNCNTKQLVATKVPNELGLFDMTGNAAEWCQDWYSDYIVEPQTNPTGPTSDLGYGNVLRGGHYNEDARYCRVSYRFFNLPSSSVGGLRLALDNNTITDTPFITTEMNSKTMTVTATGKGNIILYVNGQAVNNPFIVNRKSKSYSITAYATAKEQSKEKSQSEEQAILIPALGQEIFNVNGTTFTMVYVNGGTFTMGATDEQGTDAKVDEYPAHKVTVSSYFIGQTAVTQELWEAVMGHHYSDFSSEQGYANWEKRPAVQVSWNDCQEFIAKLNLLTGKHFRLPTEAEWEFAARGGNNNQHYKYAGSNDINEVAWWDFFFDGNSAYGPNPVSQKAPNKLELYDMSGNVNEWCQDWYGSYNSAAQTNPAGPDSGSFRVSRGGSWISGANDCRVSKRLGSDPTYRILIDTGLRLAL